MKEKMNKISVTRQSVELLVAALCLALAGCANLGPEKSSVLPPASIQRPSETAGRVQPVQVEAVPGSIEQTRTETVSPTIIRGTDRMFNPPRLGEEVTVSGEAVLLRFEQAPVTDVVHAILGDVLGLPYVVNQPVTGTLTVHTNSPLPRSQALSVLESVLQANGLAMAVDSSGVYHVGRPESLRGLTRAFTNPRNLPPGQNMVIVPLQYVGATEMADILRPLAPAEAFVRVDTIRNLLVLAGSRANIDGWLDIVRTFDIDILKGMSLGLFPLKYTSVKEVESGLRALIAGTGTIESATPQSGVQSSSGGASGGGAALSLPGPISGVVRLIGIERLNALLVVTPRAHYLDVVRDWIEKLDQPRNGGSEPQLYVYPVQNGNAAHLAGLLSAIYGVGAQSASAAPIPQRAVAPALGEIDLGGGAATGVGLASTGAASAGASSAGTGMVQSMLGDNVKVVADERNNALLIYAPASEYEKVANALRKLDISPTQVLIEASIVEVTLTDELKYGLQWYFNGSLGSDYQGQGQLTSGQTNAIGPINPGFSYSVLNSASQVRAVLTALAQKSLINVISSPSVLVQDNHTAEIQVGDQQPVRSTTTITDGGTTQNSIEYKDTGVALSVTPSVNAGGMVSMDVRQTVTDVGQIDAATGQRSFLQRQFSSRVAVRSGESVVLGGLIRDNSSRGKQGVPLLQDIPLVGALFSTTSTTGTRTELVVLITPRVIRSDADLRALSDEIREHLSGTLGALPSWSAMSPTRSAPEGLLPANDSMIPEASTYPVK